MSSEPDFSAALVATIKKHREANGMSLAELARKAGLAQTYPGRVEKGQYRPTVDVVYRMAKALGIKLSDLVREAERSGRR